MNKAQSWLNHDLPFIILRAPQKVKDKIMQSVSPYARIVLSKTSVEEKGVSLEKGLKRL